MTTVTERAVRNGHPLTRRHRPQLPDRGDHAPRMPWDGSRRRWPDYLHGQHRCLDVVQHCAGRLLESDGRISAALRPAFRRAVSICSSEPLLSDRSRCAVSSHWCRHPSCRKHQHPAFWTVFIYRTLCPVRVRPGPGSLTGRTIHGKDRGVAHPVRPSRFASRFRPAPFVEGRNQIGARLPS